MGKCISTAEKLGKELRDSYERWNHILQNGAGDPFWKDGANMNLVRNHIFITKGSVKLSCFLENTRRSISGSFRQRWTINIWHSRKKSGNTP